jgi:hypothetical protein
LRPQNKSTFSPADIELHEHDARAYVSSGSFSVLKVNICKNLVGLASWVEEIIEEADASTQDKLLTDFEREPFTTFACYALKVPEYRLLNCTVLYTNTIHST